MWKVCLLRTINRILNGFVAALLLSIHLLSSAEIFRRVASSNLIIMDNMRKDNDTQFRIVFLSTTTLIFLQNQLPNYMY